jgi:hypothetical protein
MSFFSFFNFRTLGLFPVRQEFLPFLLWYLVQGNPFIRLQCLKSKGSSLNRQGKLFLINLNIYSREKELEHTLGHFKFHGIYCLSLLLSLWKSCTCMHISIQKTKEPHGFLTVKSFSSIFYYIHKEEGGVSCTNLRV